MNLSLSWAAAPAELAEQNPVFVVAMSGEPDRLGIDNVYDAILRAGRNRAARVVVDLAQVRSRDAAEPMLFAADEALDGRLTVVGA